MHVPGESAGSTSRGMDHRRRNRHRKWQLTSPRTARDAQRRGIAAEAMPSEGVVRARLPRRSAAFRTSGLLTTPGPLSRGGRSPSPEARWQHILSRRGSNSCRLNCRMGYRSGGSSGVPPGRSRCGSNGPAWQQLLPRLMSGSWDLTPPWRCMARRQSLLTEGIAPH